ncbi:nucleoside triphosphate pyrophosphohydrolase family protein [bacterium]|nr:nucleoside triphosphate pyrophosphohydrolase family protein [bacterium]
MTISEYQKRTYIAIQPHTDLKDEILNWSIGLSEECGEVMNHIKHHCWGNEPVDAVELAKEIGDVMWYSAALCTALNLNLETVCKLNMRKLEHRFGGEFTEEKSKARHENEQKFSETEEYKQLISELCLGEEKCVNM